MADRVIDRLITIFSFRVDTQALDRSRANLERTQQTLARAGTTVAIAGAALTGVGFILGSTALAFETAVNNLAAVTGASADDLNRFREQARELGRTTQFTASQVVQAQLALSQSGLQVNEVLSAMPHVLNLAAAGQLNMGEAAELVTKSLQPFQLGMEHAARLADIMAQAARSSNTTVRELGPAFRQAAVEAATAGLSLEQFGAFLAVARNNARQAGQAGTQFRTVALSLVRPSNQSAEAIRALGLDWEELSRLAQSGQLDTALRMLRDAGLDLGSAAVIFGREAAGLGLAFAQQLPTYDRILERLNSADGVVRTMAETQMRGLPGAVRELSSAWEGMQLAMAESGLVSILTTLANIFTSILRALGELPGPLRVFVVLLIASGPILIAFGAGLRLISAAFGLMPLFIQNAILGLIAYVKGVVAATVATYGLWRAILILLGPLGLLLAGLGALAHFTDGFGLLPSAPDVPEVGGGGFRPEGQTQPLLSPETGRPIEAPAQPAGQQFDNRTYDNRSFDNRSFVTNESPRRFDQEAFATAQPGGVGQPAFVQQSAQERFGNQAFAAAQPSGNRTLYDNRQRNFTVGEMNITVPNGDSQEIATNVDEALRQRFSQAAFDADSDILR